MLYKIILSKKSIRHFPPNSYFSWSRSSVSTRYRLKRLCSNDQNDDGSVCVWFSATPWMMDKCVPTQKDVSLKKITSKPASWASEYGGTVHKKWRKTYKEWWMHHLKTLLAFAMTDCLREAVLFDLLVDIQF